MKKAHKTDSLLMALLEFQEATEWKNEELADALGVHENTIIKWKKEPPRRLHSESRVKVEDFLRKNQHLMKQQIETVAEKPAHEMDFVQCAETFKKHLETMRDHGYLDKQSLKALLAVDDVIESIIPAA